MGALDRRGAVPAVGYEVLNKMFRFSASVSLSVSQG